MKHVIGKRNGKTIVSGGGSLEEQKNNLKHWEVLDEESSPMKDRYNKRIKIDPQDVFLIHTYAATALDTFCIADYRTVNVIGEIEKFPEKHVEYDAMGEPVENSAINTENIIEIYSGCSIYRPIKGNDGIWEFIVPVAYGPTILDKMDQNGQQFWLCVGFPFHYKVSENSDGDVFVKAAPNGTGIDACEKKYNIFDSELRSVFYKKPSDTAIETNMIYVLQRNAQVQNFSLTIDTASGSNAIIKNLNVVDDNVNWMSNNISSKYNNLMIDEDVIPYPYGGNDNLKIFEFPKMRIKFKALTDGA